MASAQTINVRPAHHSPPSRESDGFVKTADPDVETTACCCCPAPTHTPDERLADWQHHIPGEPARVCAGHLELSVTSAIQIGMSMLDWLKWTVSTVRGPGYDSAPFSRPSTSLDCSSCSLCSSAFSIDSSVQVIDTLLPDSNFGGLIEKALSAMPVTGKPGNPDEVIILQLCVALAVLVLLFNIGMWVVMVDTWWADCNFEQLDDSELARKKGNGYLSCFSYWLAHWLLAKLSCLCCCVPSCVWLLIEIVLQVFSRFSTRIANAVSWACSFLNVAQILVYACILNKLLYYDLWCVGASGNPMERLGEKLYLTGYGGLPTASPSPSPSPLPPPSPLPFPPSSPSPATPTLPFPSPFPSHSSSSNSSSTAPLNTGRRHLLATLPPPPPKPLSPVPPSPAPLSPSHPTPPPPQATANIPSCAESDLPAKMSKAIFLAMVMAVFGTVIFLVGQIRGLGNKVVAGLLFTALTILVLIKSLAASFVFIQVHRLNTVLGKFQMDDTLGLSIANLMFSYLNAGATILWTGFVLNVVGRLVQRFCDMSECGLIARFTKPSAPDATALAKSRYRVQQEVGVHGEKLVYLADWHYVADGGQAMGKVTPGDIPVTQHADANADVVRGMQKAARIAIVVMALGWLGLCIISSSLCLTNFAKVSSLTLDPASRGWLEYDRATSIIILVSSCMLYPVYVYFTVRG